MENLPFVDEHRVHVDSTPERAWGGVMRLAYGRLSRPAPAALAAVWRLEPVSGFMVVKEVAPKCLVLRGGHRFSRYELAFEIDPVPEGVTLSARTSALFLGVAGSAYRSLVIGSGGHAWVVRRMLRHIARSAQSGPHHQRAIREKRRQR